MQYKVVLTDHVYPDLKLERDILARAGAELDFIDSRDEEVIAKAVVDADILITCYAEITAKVIEGMTKCKSISKTGIGVNNIDLEAATKKGIRVMNVSDYCIEEVSDHTVALTLAGARKLIALNDNVKKGDWSLKGCAGIRRLLGKTFGLLGFGRIARRVAEKIAPFGTRIIACDPYISAEAMATMGVIKAEMDEVYAKSDIISLNLPLTAETKGMINDGALKKMKPNAVIINTSRGPLINESDLCRAVRDGVIAGAALDVICDERYDLDNPIFSTPGIILTPHSAFYSVESTRELREKILADVLTVLDGGEPKYQVNN